MPSQVRPDVDPGELLKPPVFQQWQSWGEGLISLPLVLEQAAQEGVLLALPGSFPTPAPCLVAALFIAPEGALCHWHLRQPWHRVMMNFFCRGTPDLDLVRMDVGK